MEEQQGKGTVRCALGDDPQLFAHGVVVVIAVDHGGLRDLEMSQRVEAGLADELEVVALRVKALKLRLRRWVDGQHACTRARRPLQEEPGEVAGVGPDLDDGARARRVEHGEDDLGQLDEGDTEMPFVIGVVVDVVPVDLGVQASHGAGEHKRKPLLARAARAGGLNRACAGVAGGGG